MGTRIQDRSRPSKRPQTKFSTATGAVVASKNISHRPIRDLKGYPATNGNPLPAQARLISDVDNISSTMPFTPGSVADLTAMKAHATQGDGNYAGSTFDSGEFIILGDFSTAHFDTATWYVADMGNLFAGMPFTPGDIATLVAMRADGTYGSALGPSGAPGTGDDFASGEFIILGDFSKSHYIEPSWIVGTSTGSDPFDTSAAMGFTPASIANIAAIRAEGTYGSALGPGGAPGTDDNFAVGEYIILTDASLANYIEPSWIVGTSTGADPFDISAAMAFDPTTFANLAAIIADGTYGDALGPSGASGSGSDFTTGQYIILGDASLANYVEPDWTVGVGA